MWVEWFFRRTRAQDQTYTHVDEWGFLRLNMRKIAYNVVWMAVCKEMTVGVDFFGDLRCARRPRRTCGSCIARGW